ncbi:hypothetical protein [Cerasicoccus maritimus]|uniref:hypothetical protein n=1 Tax=Cerasicoccus maritimus TaxID=490089 RepID=UPI002852A809|nr:hypothetical protein [Cerasicoccus maritimus]
MYDYTNLPLCKGSYSKILATSLCIFLLSAVLLRANLDRALWVWDAECITNSTKRSDLFNFCTTKGITTIFINTGSAFVAPSDSAYSSKHPVTNPQLGQFNIAAHNLGLQVHALDGDPSFCLNSQHSRALGRMQKAVNFNYNQASNARLDGFNWDIEPHGLTAWSNATNQQKLAYLNGLLLVAEQLTDESIYAMPELPIGFTIPFWYDNSDYIRTFNGLTQETTFHLFDIVSNADNSYIAIMAYRDDAFSSFSIAEDEYNYAKLNTPAVKIWHGLETGPFSPEYITFNEEGEFDLNSNIALLESYLSPYLPSNADVVAGVAIHSYQYYSAW